MEIIFYTIITVHMHVYVCIYIKQTRLQNNTFYTPIISFPDFFLYLSLAFLSLPHPPSHKSIDTVLGTEITVVSRHVVPALSDILD